MNPSELEPALIDPDEPKTMRVSLFGPFAPGNLGGAATQSAMIEAIRHRVRGADISIVSLSPTDSFERHGLRSHPIGRMAEGGWAHQVGHSNAPTSTPSWLPRWAAKTLRGTVTEWRGAREAARYLDEIDLLLVSGGDQLDDSTGGPWHHPYSLALWTLLARIRRVPVAFVSVGAAPLHSRMSRLLVRLALSMASYRSFRDLPSRGYVKRTTGFFRNDPICPDLAFGLDHPSRAQAATLSKRRGGEKDNGLPREFPGKDLEESSRRSLIAIGPLHLRGSSIWTVPGSRSYAGYLEELVGAVEQLVKNGHGVSLFPGDIRQDEVAIHDMFRAIQKRLSPDLRHLVSEAPVGSVEDLVDHLNSATCVVASRFHGVLLAQLQQKPVVSVSHQSKVSRLMRDSGMGQFSLDMASFTSAELVTAVENMVSEQHDISRRLGAYASLCRGLLDRQYHAVLAFGSNAASRRFSSK